ncbi:hypothetical protein [Saccharopolyspora spinosa]|uniref:Lipoprotein LprG n=1 Tax=Saccharopolyspora spinosa TaxID=60894 RepID=A0A2N3YAJ9_SACSN|nr:hypothetical protein [Saccharopolyspora spinosa]PKW19939.1 hypothetical protein A8926_8143 [Saccharopolyspora spinosa]
MRRTAVALSAAALTITLGACSQGGSPAAPDNPGQQQTENSGSSFKDISSLVSSAKSSMSEKKTVTVSFEGTGAIQSLGSTKCQLDIAQTEMACTGPTEMVFTRDGLYIKSPQLAQLSGDPSKPWLKMSANDSMAQQLGQLGKINDFGAMLPPGSTITASTKEQVDGQDATRYEIVTDLKAAVVGAKAEEKAAYEALVGAGVSEIKQTVWLDAEGLPIKANSTTPALNVAGQQIPESTMTVRYSDWGKPVQINIPPADQVQEKQQ